MTNKKNKVLQIVGAPAGGIRKHIVDIICNLPSEQYEIGLAASFKDADTTFKTQMPKLSIKCKNRLYDLNIPKKPSFQDIRNIYHLFHQIQKERYDVIHGHGAKGGLYARILGILLGTKVIYTPHGGSLHSMHGKVNNFLYAFVEKLLYPFTNRLIFESEYSRDTYFKKVFRADKKSIVNYNGIDAIEAYKIKTPPTKEKLIKICAFGILRYEKGHEILIRATKLLFEQGYQLEVNIFGEGKERNSLYQLIQDLDLQNVVFLRGETDQVIELMKKHDILVHPSRFESFGYVVIEAMSVGLPVIASSVGGLKEIICDYADGIFVDGINPQLYAKAIQELIENPKLYSKISEAGYAKAISKFSKQHMIATLEDIYNAR